METNSETGQKPDEQIGMHAKATVIHARTHTHRDRQTNWSTWPDRLSFACGDDQG